MIKSKVITNVWLKRNPLMSESASDIFRVIEHSPALRTLDLDQTELGDDGVAQLFRLLAKFERLQKWWAEGDDTLWQVQHSMVFDRENGGRKYYAPK
ncbi:hypothetical protein AC578_57 [Pseudocercospora eumusae]|uniref:Uncharacterized protein n=1 Tax=Pseudocercospora eumusae TaxID=321146 RepID=A0A139HP03_9PEZI|nr:hypothetical protein AC578_57 [Pseudocercospora eumusae]